MKTAPIRSQMFPALLQKFTRWSLCLFCLGARPAELAIPAAAPHSADWLREARLGVFMHFLPGNADALAKVNDFDVPALTRQLKAMGAAYLVQAQVAQVIAVRKALPGRAAGALQPFFAFENCLKLSPAELAAPLQELGYDGLSASGYKVAPLLEALPRLFFVSINGADTGDTQKQDWSRLIQTLDRGSYDVAGFVRTLRNLGYTGPVGLQCYNLKGDQTENLQRSIAAWRKFSSPFPQSGQR